MAEDISTLLKKYVDLNLNDVQDHEKFNEFSITHHSTTIEGSTLTEVETQLLLEEGITPKGKPLMHSLMVKDHYEALRFILKSAVDKRSIFF
jgi:Fic family protein